MSTAGTEKLGSLVKSYEQLEVEDYQRVYVWDADDLSSLFQDIKTCADFPKDRDHFFGTLILQSDATNAPNRAKVVDGQQRLTSTFLLMAAFRDAIQGLEIHKLPAQGTRRATDVLDKTWKFLIHDDDLAQQRFLPNRLLRNMMRNSVIPDPDGRPEVPWTNRQTYEKPTEITLPFRRAVRVVRNLVMNDIADHETDLDKLTRINLLIDTLLERFTVLKVTTSSIDESLDIFLTLNSRGQELKASDLARGEILKKLTLGLTEEKLIQDVHKQNLKDWDLIGQLVGDHEVFLRHFLVSTSYSQITKKMILGEITARLNPKEADGQTDVNRAINFWSDLKKAAAIYGRIIRPKFVEPTQTYILLLNELLVSHRVLLMNLLNTTAPDKNFDENVRLTFVLAYRWMLIGLNSQDLENYFRDLGRDFSTNKKTSADVQVALADKIDDLPPVSKKKWETNRDGSPHARALLYMLYFISVGKQPLKWKLSDFHLEHIAPQTRTDTWILDALGEDDPNEVDDDQWKTLVSAAGNLTLLDPGINLKIQNDPFRTGDACPANEDEIDNKVCWYRKSVLEINKDICDQPVWNSSIIAQRSEWLAEMFENIWAVEPKHSELVSFSEWLEGAES
jgi:hypothetical protein